MTVKRDKPFEWGGFRLIDETVAYHVGPLPGRKRIVLYRMNNGILWPIAYFNNEDDAKEFVLWLERLANLSNNLSGMLKRLVG